MTTRTSRVLFVVALAAVVAFAWLELPRRRAAQLDDDARRLFPPFASAIDGIHIERAGESLRFEIVRAHWQMTAPVRDAAEYSRLATLVDAIERAEIERHLGAAEDPSRFGLAPPVAVVTLIAAGDTLARIALGAHTVDGAFAYARRPDGDVVLVPPAIVAAVTLPIAEYRDQNLVRFDLDQAHAFTVRREGHPTVRWNRRGAEDWFTVVDGDTVAGDSVDVLSHLRRFRGMRVRAFVDPADTTGAFDRLAGSVTVHTREPAFDLTMRFVARPGGVYWCRVDGASRVVDVEGDVPAALDASLGNLRDRRLLHFAPLRARRLEVVTPDTSAVLMRAGDAWAIPNPALGRIDPRRAADLVRALRSLRYRRVVDAPPRTVEPAVITLVVAADGDTILDELRARPRDGSGDTTWIATSRSTRVVTEVSAPDIGAIVDRLRRLRTPPGR